MFNIIETNMSRRNVIKTAPTFETAIDALCEMGVAFMEEDADYPDCADALLNDGRIVVIEPVGFKLL